MKKQANQKEEVLRQLPRANVEPQQTTVRKPTPGFKDIVYCTGDPDIDAELFFQAIGKRPQSEVGTASQQVSTTTEFIQLTTENQVA